MTEESKADTTENPKCDLISRADALKEIEAEEKMLERDIADAKENPDKYTDNFVFAEEERLNGLGDAYIIISALPSAEAVQVVRCKDCRYYEQDVWREVDGVPIIVAHHICEFWNGACHVKPDGYCSFGELAEKGGDAEMQTIAKTPDYMQQSRHDDGRPQEELLTHCSRGERREK